MITKAYNGKAIIVFNEAKHYYTVSVKGICDKLYQPGVTTIIGMKDKSGALVSWATEQFAERMKALVNTAETWEADTLCAVIDVAKDTWRKKRDEAASIGSIAHRALEATLLGHKPKLPLKIDDIVSPNVTQDMMDMANNSIEAGLQFIREHKIEVIEAEAPRWSPRHGYIGTGDLIARIDGRLAVLDWKTSKRLYPTVRMQLSAYGHAWMEEHPEQRVELRVPVNIGRDGVLEYEIHENTGCKCGCTDENDFNTFLGLLNVWHWDRVNQGKWSQPPVKRLTPEQITAICS